jgi:hypothetical protein
MMPLPLQEKPPKIIASKILSAMSNDWYTMHLHPIKAFNYTDILHTNNYATIK